MLYHIVKERTRDRDPGRGKASPVYAGDTNVVPCGAVGVDRGRWGAKQMLLPAYRFPVAKKKKFKNN